MEVTTSGTFLTKRLSTGSSFIDPGPDKRTFDVGFTPLSPGESAAFDPFSLLLIVLIVLVLSSGSISLAVTSWLYGRAPSCVVPTDSC